MRDCGGQVVRSRSNYENYPTEFKASPNQGAVDGFPIKVYSQGIYQGRYTLNIPKDAWAFNMNDELENHCILCSEGYISGCFREASVSQWTDEIHDTMPTSISTKWIEIINFIINSTDEEFKTNLSNYFYVDSLIDYLIYGIVSCGLDAFGKNQIYSTYDGQKWIASMYDMDSTWGLWYNGSKFVGYDYPRESFEDYNVNGGNLLYIRLAQLFIEKIQTRYEELKATVLTIPNIINQFERFTDITPTDLVKEDYAVTTANGSFVTIPSTDTNNIQQIRDYIINRFAYADEYINGLIYDGGDDTTIKLSSINATYDGGDVVAGTDINDLTLITVTATYSDGSTKNITDYTLSGSIVEGINTITVSYNGKTTTFTVVGYAEESDGIDYATNLLSNATYVQGYEPNKTTGVLTAASGVGCFEKITLPYTHMYEIKVSANYTKSNPAVFLYDDNDNYIGVFYATGLFTAKAGYKCIIQYYPSAEGTDYSDTKLLPYKPDTISDKISINLNDYTWTTYGSHVKIDISSYNINYKCIATSNIVAQFERLCDIYSLNVEPLACFYFSGDGIVKELFIGNMTIDNITTYLEENPTTIILNE